MAGKTGPRGEAGARAKAKAAKGGGRAAIGAQLLELARDLESEPMTYARIRARYRISQPTAYRRIQELDSVFGGAVDQAIDENGEALFSMRRGSSSRFAFFGDADIVLLKEAAKHFDASRRPDDARRLRKMAQAILDSMPPTRRSKVDVDAASLAEREGIAMRAGPRPKLDPRLIDRIRHAILAQRVVEIDYASRIGRRLKTHRLEPHGILFGHRNYLVAFFEQDTTRGPALFALTSIQKLAIDKASFRFRDGFDIDAFSRQSFGVWQGDPIDVVWRFAADRAPDVMETHFHATEAKTILNDGSVEVRFSASGQTEMLYHLFTWEDSILAIEPESLRARYAALLDRVRKAAAGGTS
jgi:predicted DNA-binding transcriptional regulator YafY